MLREWKERKKEGRKNESAGSRRGEKDEGCWDGIQKEETEGRKE